MRKVTSLIKNNPVKSSAIGIITVILILGVTTLIFTNKNNNSQKLNESREETTNTTIESEEKAKQELNGPSNQLEASTGTENANTQENTPSSTPYVPQGTINDPTAQAQQQPTVNVPTCNESLKDSYTAVYNSRVSSENSRLANEIARINQSWQDRGMYSSGGREAEVNSARSASTANLSYIDNDYYNKLSSINC